MSTPRIFHRTAQRAELATVVDSLRERGLQFIYYEASEAVELLAYRTPQAAWHTGRAFGETLEVQWTRNGDAFDLLLLTEKEMNAPEGWEKWQPLCSSGAPTIQPQTQRVRLYGTERRELASYHYRATKSDAPAEWIETRVPRPLVYPIENAPKHVSVQSIVYCFDGVAILTRWQRLVKDERD